MKLKQIPALLLSALPAIAAANATVSAAAQTPLAGEAFLVTATRTAQPLAQSLAQANVITREEIERSGGMSLVELLQARAALEIRTAGGAGQPTEVFIRAAQSSHTLVLVDGLRVGSGARGASALENIPLALIERIEIVKGPLSGLYGSGAIGGVIQIFTRTSSTPLLYANAGVGSQHTRDIAAGFSTNESATSATFHAGYGETKGPSASNAQAQLLFNPDHDPYRNEHGKFRLAHTFYNGETLALSAFYSRGRTRFDAGPDSNDLNRQTLSGYQLNSSKEFSPGWYSHLTIGRGSDDRIVEGPSAAHFKTRQDQLIWLNEFKTVTGNMTAGVDVRNERVFGIVPDEKSRREARALFAGYLEKIDAQQIEFSLRRDVGEHADAQLGSHNSGSASYGWYLSPAMFVFARGGRAFRSPSFEELYRPANALSAPAGNPNLLPERSKSGEVGVRYSAGALNASIVGFDQKIEDLIGGSPLVNIGRTSIRGLEFSFDTKLMGYEVRAKATHQRPRDEDSGTQLHGRAKSFGSLSVAKTWGAWQASTTLVGSGARFDSAMQAAGSRMGGYGLVHAQVRYTVNKQWSVALSGNNLADKKYELAQGYNTPGRTLFLSVKFEAR